MIVLHCDGLRPDQHNTVKKIDDYHRSKGWKGIGYHFWVNRQGEVFTGRRLEVVGAHADFLIGIEAYANLAVLDLGMLLQILYGSDYLSDTGFVIGPQKGCAVAGSGLAATGGTDASDVPEGYHPWAS